MVTIRSILLWLTGVSLVVISYANIWGFNKWSTELPRSFQSDVVVQELRYEPVRELLLDKKYRGNIAFITNRDLKSEKSTQEDNNRWVHAQFALIPWVVVRGTRSVSGQVVNGTQRYVIADFWDSVPPEFPSDLTKVYESKDGLVLLVRKSSE